MFTHGAFFSVRCDGILHIFILLFLSFAFLYTLNGNITNGRCKRITPTTTAATGKKTPRKFYFIFICWTCEKRISGLKKLTRPQPTAPTHTTYITSAIVQVNSNWSWNIEGSVNVHFYHSLQLYCRAESETSNKWVFIHHKLLRDYVSNFSHMCTECVVILTLLLTVCRNNPHYTLHSKLVLRIYSFFYKSDLLNDWCKPNVIWWIRMWSERLTVSRCEVCSAKENEAKTV